MWTQGQHPLLVGKDPFSFLLFRSQIYYYNTRLLCACSACSLGMWLTRPIHDDKWRQSIFIYARCYQIIKHESMIFTSFIIRSWSAAFADPCTRISSQWKEDRLVLLRIMRKLMNIACRLLKSRAAMTEWWGLCQVRSSTPAWGWGSFFGGACQHSQSKIIPRALPLSRLCKFSSHKADENQEIIQCVPALLKICLHFI